MRLRRNLLLLVIATAVPLVVLAVLASFLLVSHEQSNFIRAVKDRNRAFMSAVDVELKGHVSSLQAFTALRSIAQGDMRAVHEDLVAMRRTQPSWFNVVLSAPDGRQLVNSLVPYGDPLPPTVEPASIERAIGTGQPVIGRIGERPFLSKHSVTVHVPLMRAGNPVYVITAHIDPAVFQTLIVEQQLPEGWISGLVDAQDRFVARVPPRELGSLAGARYRAEVAAAAEGWFRGSTVEGRDTFTAFVRSAYSGWSVGFAIPASEVVAAANRTGLIMGGMALVCIGLAIVAALRVGRRISTPIGRLVAEIPALGDRPPVRIESEIDEVRELAGAMSNVSAAIRERRRLSDLEHKMLADSDRAKDEFLAMLSHEMRNPLAALTNASTVLRLAPHGEEADKAKQVIERQVKQMGRLIEDLLDVSRITLGKARLQFEPVELSALVLDVLRTWQQSGKFAQHDVVTDLLPTWVNGDRARLEQVLTNLLDNAIKFTPAQRRILLSVGERDGEANVTITDSGIGIPAEDLAHVFELFVQAPQGVSRTKGGMGVGLAIVERLIAMHGGTVVAASAGAGLGTTFTVTLPSVQAPPIEPDARSAVAPTKRSLTMLVVEDNADARNTLSALLRLQGHRVPDAENGHAAIASIADSKPDVAFVDIGLPDLDGYAVAARVRALPGAGSILLVALTGYGQPEDKARALEAGFDYHVTKPIGLEQIERLLGELIQPEEAPSAARSP